jgi:coenzyme PQQ synthesis protein D (PqqD)
VQQQPLEDHRAVALRNHSPVRALCERGQKVSDVVDETLVSRCSELLEAEIDGDLVALDVQRGSCFGFNATAKDIWFLLETPRNFASLCEALLEKYDVMPEICRAGVAALVVELSREKLVTLSPAP